MSHGFPARGSTGGLTAVLAAAGLFASTAAGFAAPGYDELSVGQMRNFSFFDPPKAAPDIAFVDAEGRELELADFRGKFVLVNLWATWCGPCRREMPSLDRLQSRLGGGDFTVLALSQDRKGPAAVETFLAGIGVRNLGVYVDTSARSARRLGAVGLPTSVLLDREGRMVGRLIGSAEWDSDEAARLIKTVIRDRRSRVKTAGRRDVPIASRPAARSSSRRTRARIFVPPSRHPRT